MKVKKVFEYKSKNPINYKKLLKYAEAIEICCNGEYGSVHYNEINNHIFVCLGDANPYDEDMLKEFMIEAISTDYKSQKYINITLENESLPPKDGWKVYNSKKNDFI